MVRPIGEGRLRLGDRGERLVVYSIEARSNGHTVRFIPEIQIMSNDGMQVEKEPPVGAQKPTVAVWRKREGGTYPGPGAVTLAPEDADGIWDVEIEVHDDAVIRLNVTLEAA